MKASTYKILQTALISVYIIFLAGSVVRMTGSGMGCPDWPKCFGYTIPPTSEEQLIWKSNTQYAKGIIIISNEELLVAKKDFRTSDNFNAENWKKYTKHDYAKFNVYHTWTEYVNRLSSVVSGFIFLALLIVVTLQKEKIKWVATYCWLAFGGMLFEAWLGKTVVDSNLTPYIITIHMIGGLFIIAALLRAKYLLNRTQEQNKKKYQKTFQALLIVSLLLMVFQILLGTQVRQYVDDQVKLFGFEMKELHLLNPSIKFYIHRSFTIIVVLINAFLFLLNRKYHLGFDKVNWIAIFLVLEAFTGILMYYVDFPFGTQAIHLLSGAVLFGLLLYMYFESKGLKNIE